MSEEPKHVILKAKSDPNSKEAIEFYRWLGMCVSGWAFIDRRLYQIFHHCVRFDQKQSAFLYYRNRAFNQRLRMVDDAAKMFLPVDIYDSEWKPLRTEVENLSHTRNIFAHHPTLRAGISLDGKPLDIYLIYIEPYERALNNDYPGLQGKDMLAVDDLQKHDADIEGLEKSLESFAWRVGGLVAEAKSKESRA